MSKEKTTEKTTSGSIGLGTIVFLIFLVMKLGEIGQVAEWSWFWVTSPLWIPIAFLLGLGVTATLISLILLFFNNINNK
jgi:hypothetical protein